MKRVPVETPNPLSGVTRSIQVNHCRMPDCDNYGALATTKRVRSGPSSGRDPIMSYRAQTRGEFLVLNASVAARN